MPTYEMVFSSVVSATIEANSLEEAQAIAEDYPTGELDWVSNVVLEDVQEEN